jgi:hypothetical protein
MSVKSRGIALTAALAALAFAAPAAQANVGGFEGGDGTETAGNCSPVLDWSCLAPSQYVATIDPAAPADDVFNSSHEGDIDQWQIGPGTVGTAKADVQAVWSYSSTNATHDTNYLDLAFKRAAGSGDSYVAFELNQSGAKYVNHVGSWITCRTNGDAIISFEISPSSTPVVNVYKWTWTSGTPCTAGQ